MEEKYNTKSEYFFGHDRHDLLSNHLSEIKWYNSEVPRLAYSSFAVVYYHISYS